MSHPRQESQPRPLGTITRNYLQLNGLLNNLPGKDAETAPKAQVFVHPILTPEDFKKTKARYNRFIKKYNAKVDQENKEIRTYNKEVINHRRHTKVPAKVRIMEMLWREDHKGLPVEEYNEAVEKYNLENGPQIRKKVYRQKVKTATREYFLSFLHQYNMQLFNRKNFRISMKLSMPTELPKLEIYPNKIVESEWEGCKNIEATVETVRHHRERLEEAGVLTDYSYHGPNRPIKIAFNPEILSITDNGTSKNATAGNQTLSPSQTNKVQHNNVSSSVNSLVKSKSSEKGDLQKSKSHENCTRTPTGSSTGTPTRQGVKAAGTTKKNKPGPRKKFTEALDQKELSAILTTTLEDKIDLSRDLSAGKHNDYTPISPSIGKQEAYYGGMHPEDFKELALQDIFKFSASLFQGMQVHPGAWMNAYKIWYLEMFRNFNKQQLSNPNLFAKWMKCIEVIRQIKKYQLKHPDWQPTFPSLFFDPARRDKLHNSFAYAYDNFKLEEENVSDFQKRKVNAEKSLRYRTDMERARDKIRQCIRGKCDVQDVYNYVRHSCGREVAENLDTLFKKEFEKYNA